TSTTSRKIMVPKTTDNTLIATVIGPLRASPTICSPTPKKNSGILNTTPMTMTHRLLLRIAVSGSMVLLMAKMIHTQNQKSGAEVSCATVDENLLRKRALVSLWKVSRTV